MFNKNIITTTKQLSFFLRQPERRRRRRRRRQGRLIIIIIIILIIISTYFKAATATRRDRDIGTNRTLLAKDTSSSRRDEDEVTLVKPSLLVAAEVGLTAAARAMRPVATQNDWYNLCDGIASLRNAELSLGGLILIVSKNIQNLSRRSFLSSGVSCLS